MSLRAFARPEGQLLDPQPGTEPEHTVKKQEGWSTEDPERACLMHQ